MRVLKAIKSGAISRKRAFLSHLTASIGVVSAVLLVLYFVWYPGDFFTMSGVMSALKVLIFVDVVLGPALTLLLFKPGKPGLLFDVSAILIVQIVALIYGVSVLYKERPFFLVFAIDRYELVSEYEVDTSQIADERLRQRPFADLMYVAAKRPEDPEALARYTEGVLFEGQPDIERRPEYWHAYENSRADVVSQAGSLRSLKSFAHVDGAEVDRVVERFSNEHEEIGYLPISSKHRDYVMLVDLASAEPLGIVKFYPWNDYSAPQPVE